MCTSTGELGVALAKAATPAQTDAQELFHASADAECMSRLLSVPL